MTDRLGQLILRATVRIGPDSEPGTLWGSGFFVAPGWVLTCAHVLPIGRGGAEQVGPLRVQGHRLDVRARLGYWLGGGADPEDDLALVRLVQDVPHACVRMTDRCDRPGRVSAYGWRRPQGGEPQRWDGQSECNGRDGAYGLTLAPQMEIPGGASGGPLLDRGRGVVAGVVKARRAGKDGGLAVSAAALRGFREARAVGDEDGLGADPYAELIRAHDRWHETATGPMSWVRTQEEVYPGDARSWAPRDSAEAAALLAALPRPESPAELQEMITRVLGYEPLWEDETVPVDWRDGQGWLYDPAEDTDLRSLHYLRAVAGSSARRADGAVRELERWVERRAERLPHHLRALVVERAIRLTATTCHVVADERDGPVVAVELEPDAFRPHDRFHWRIWSWRGDADTVRVLDECPADEGTPLADLPYLLSEPLARAFAQLDAGPRQTRLELALPVEHFDLDAHLWRPGPVVRSLRPHPAERPFGVHRQVVLRCLKRRGEPEEVWRERWHGIAEGGLKALPVQSPAYARDTLDAAPPGAVPVLCRPPAESHGPLAEAIGAGYGVVLWNLKAEHAHGCGEGCDRLQDRAARMIAATGRVTALPEQVRVLRERISEADEDASWAEHLALLYDDPRRPIPLCDDRLESP
ncbi:serine protease [Streptomyces canus]|uniref:VMAP-C domain-containing protein n=1 Tax=Streptomyces canus TaxID=58343 RepID=UPI00225C3723|nr:trypsin-like peptidase domain-containing protein [Streptomyces canus]MCX5258571.1 serine protease [Streptomyces canus]